MQVFQQYDSLLLEHLPVIAKQTRSFRTVTRKKKGIAGFFGGEETVQIPTSSKTLYSLNEQLILLEEERQQAINAYTDSLRVQNRELNRKLYVLIQDLDKQTQATFQGKELYLQHSYNRSTMIITGLILSAIVLLVVSYWIIQRDIRGKARTKRELEELIEKLRQSVKKNEELLAARRQIMQTIIHELRSPLSAISGNTELIIADTDEAERTRHIQAVRQSVRRMTIMLDELGCINDGQNNIKELAAFFGSLLGLEIKDRHCYDAYLDMKRRKNESRTYFLDKLSERLNLRMQRDDEKERERRR